MASSRSLPGLQTSKLCRRAQPLLGTLVDISLPSSADHDLFERGFAAIKEVQRHLSRFEPHSELSRFHELAPGEWIDVHPCSARVLRIAAMLQSASEGVFDISQGSGPTGWRLSHGRLHKLVHDVRLDLGGIAKGHAVDQAIKALQRAGSPWACVNAGGDMRVFGPQSVMLHLRDEYSGGVRAFGSLTQGSFATSHFAPSSRSMLHGGTGAARHVSVAAPRCIWADALTKIVAASGNTQHPLLGQLGARAWLH